MRDLIKAFSPDELAYVISIPDALVQHLAFHTLLTAWTGPSRGDVERAIHAALKPAFDSGELGMALLVSFDEEYNDGRYPNVGIHGYRPGWEDALLESWEEVSDYYYYSADSDREKNVVVAAHGDRVVPSSHTCDVPPDAFVLLRAFEKNLAYEEDGSGYTAFFANGSVVRGGVNQS